MLKKLLIGFALLFTATVPSIACSYEEQLNLLTGALYREANPSDSGQAAVAAVIFNRLDNPRYPKTLCGVITQSGQFQYRVPASPDRIKLALAKANASVFLSEYAANRQRHEADIFVALAGYHGFRSYGPGLEVDGNYFRRH